MKPLFVHCLLTLSSGSLRSSDPLDSLHGGSQGWATPHHIDHWLPQWPSGPVVIDGHPHRSRHFPFLHLFLVGLHEARQQLVSRKKNRTKDDEVWRRKIATAWLRNYFWTHWHWEVWDIFANILNTHTLIIYIYIYYVDVKCVFVMTPCWLKSRNQANKNPSTVWDLCWPVLDEPGKQNNKQVIYFGETSVNYTYFAGKICGMIPPVDQSTILLGRIPILLG